MHDIQGNLDVKKKAIRGIYDTKTTTKQQI